MCYIFTSVPDVQVTEFINGNPTPNVTRYNLRFIWVYISENNFNGLTGDHRISKWYDTNKTSGDLGLTSTNNTLYSVASSSATSSNQQPIMGSSLTNSVANGQYELFINSSFARYWTGSSPDYVNKATHLPFCCGVLFA